MEYLQIEAFERIVQEGSFTRAAVSLNLAQSTISMRIATLEAELGGALFERSGTSLRLTPLGEVFLPHAERMIASRQDGIQAARNYNAGRLGQITIATMETQMMYMLPGPMRQLKQQYPSVDFRIRVRMPYDIPQRIHMGEVVLGLTGAPLWDKTMRIHGHFREPMCAVTEANHPLARKARHTTISTADLYQYVVYRVTQSFQATALVERIAEQARAGNAGGVTSIPAMLALQMVLSGEGVAFLPKEFIRPHLESGSIEVITVSDLPELFNDTLLISHAGRELDKPCRVFVDIMRHHWRHLLVDSPP